MNIQGLSREFDLPVGLSDHTIGNTAAVVATGLGATFFEKHFTLDRNDPGPDSAFSIEPDELIALKRDIENAHLSIGGELVDRTKSEAQNLIFRRSLYFVADLREGETITESHVRRIRPGFGLEPRYYDTILGKKASKDIWRGQRVSLSLIHI